MGFNLAFKGLRYRGFPIGKEHRNIGTSEHRNILHVIRRRNQTGLFTLRRNCRQTHVFEGKKGCENEEEELRSYCITFKEKRR